MSIYSEGTCEVVRILEVSAHPNADKLDVCSFETVAGPAGYVCVTGKNQFKPNDLAVYVGVDSVVPLGGEHSDRWQFLTKRLDGAGKAVYRVRAARLRGLYSEGILMEPDPEDRLGDEKWDAWGITYHNPQVSVGISTGPTAPTKRAIKIHFPEYSVASLRKVPYLFDEGDQVVVTEKIHGTNARFGWVRVGWRWKFVVGSHRVIKTDMRPWYVKLWNRITGKEPKRDGGFYEQDLWNEVAEKYELPDKLWDYRGMVFYGEIYGFTTNGKGIQDLVYDGPTLGLRFFDVYDLRERVFVDYDQFALYMADCELPTVPVVYRGPFSLDTMKDLAEGKSTLAPKQIREGVVAKTFVEYRDHIPGRPRQIAKMVGEGYRLRKEQE
jgi:RNA ligase (TIGR02306 family)